MWRGNGAISKLNCIIIRFSRSGRVPVAHTSKPDFVRDEECLGPVRVFPLEIVTRTADGADDVGEGSTARRALGRRRR